MSAAFILLSSLSLLKLFGTGALPLIYPRADLQPTDDYSFIVSRTLFDIIWTCLTTTFFCVGVSLSPNVPPKQGETLKGRLSLLLWILISPELILAWALRQCFAGVHVRSRYNNSRQDNPWTLHHGYLMVMGGFTLVESKAFNPDRGDVLSFERFSQIVEDPGVTFPPVTVDEIRDRSKTDELGLLFGVLHILSFLFQCLIRHLQHLPITQLELITFNILVCNVFIIVVWWCKPKDLFVPMKIRLPPSDSKHLSPNVTQRIFSFSYLKTELDDIFFGILRAETISPGASHVPTFYAPRTTSGYYARIVAFALFGAISGAVLFTGSKTSSFSTTLELNIWRYASLAVMVIPILSVPFDIMIGYREKREKPKSFLLNWAFGTLFLLHAILKLLLIAQAFALLRAQPRAAFIIADWPLYVPHF